MTPQESRWRRHRLVNVEGKPEIQLEPWFGVGVTENKQRLMGWQQRDFTASENIFRLSWKVGTSQMKFLTLSIVSYLYVNQGWAYRIEKLSNADILFRVSKSISYRTSKIQYLFLQTLLFTAFLVTVLKISTYALGSTWSSISSGQEHGPQLMQPCGETKTRQSRGFKRRVNTSSDTVPTSI